MSAWSPAQRQALERLIAADGKAIEVPRQTAQALLRRGVVAPGRGGWVITDLGRLALEEEDRQARRQARRMKLGGPDVQLLYRRMRKADGLMTLLDRPSGGVRHMVREAIEDLLYGEEPWETGKGEKWDVSIATWARTILAIVEDVEEAYERAEEVGGTITIGAEVVPPGPADRSAQVEKKKTAVQQARREGGVTDLGSYRKRR